ncbi:hypothetical protein V1291_003083 [Nitrobacteraceae bacterium AZCC 1564]
MDGRRITTPFSESYNLQNTDTGIERNGENITDLDAVAGRFLALAVDPHMSLSDQGRSV